MRRCGAQNQVIITIVSENCFFFCCPADRCYIPLLRATDNSSQPIIGDPWLPDSSESLSLIQQHTRSPKDPVMAVAAFAGPLSPSKVSVDLDQLTTTESCPQTFVTLHQRFYRRRTFGDPGRHHLESELTTCTTSSSRIQSVGQSAWAGTSV